MQGEIVKVVDVCGKPRHEYFRQPPPEKVGYLKVKHQRGYVSGWVHESLVDLL